jgi:cyclic beta-1,2-glucan synthetase
MYRLGIEAILGLHKLGDRLEVDPCIPPDWKSYQITYRFGKSVYLIQVENPDGTSTGVSSVSLDGKLMPDRLIPLQDDGQEHVVKILMAPGVQRSGHLHGDIARVLNGSSQ